jgi:VanZ family protein
MRHCLTSLNGSPNYVIKDVFTNTDWHHIRIHITSSSLKVHINGNTIFTAPLPYQHLQSWDSSYRLALGNELTGDRPWLGDIRKAVIHVGENIFDYLAYDALEVPHTYVVMHSRVLKDRNVILLPFFNNRNYRASLEDWEINFINFVPFGWLLVLFRSPRPGLLFAIVLTAAVSATIEVAQLLFTVDRIPSTEDFILNTLGGAIGAWLAQHYVIYIRRRPV